MNRSGSSCALEALECRQLMAAIVLNGTPYGDHFSIDNVNPGDTLTINGNGGYDVIHIGEAAHTMQNIRGAVSVHNPSGQLSLIFDDAADTGLRSVFVSGHDVTGLAPATISFDNGAIYDVFDGTGNNTITVANNSASIWIDGGPGDEHFNVNQHTGGEQLTIDSGAGNDQVLLAASTGCLDDVGSPIRVIGSEGQASAILQDMLATVGHTYWLTSITGAEMTQGLSIARSGPTANIELDDVSGLHLKTSNHDDIVYAGGATDWQPSIGINTGDGNDTVFADNNAADSIDGGNGSDTVTLDVYDAWTGFETVKTPASSGSISGWVFNDLNGNGIKDTGEGGRQGVQIYLDQDNDKVWDSNEAGEVTDTNGNFKFIGVPSGKEFIVREYLTGTGLVQTTPSSGYGIHVTLAPGTSAVNRQFGVHVGPVGSASIAGCVFNDLNGNGVKDAGESGLSGRTVWIDLDNDKVLDANEQRTTTDAYGNFKLAGLVAGTYKVRQQLPAGWAQTTPSNGYGLSVTLTSGQATTGKLFGEKKIV